MALFSTQRTIVLNVIVICDATRHGDCAIKSRILKMCFWSKHISIVLKSSSRKMCLRESVIKQLDHVTHLIDQSTLPGRLASRKQVRLYGTKRARQT